MALRGRPAVADIGGTVNESRRIALRSSDTLRLCVDVMARRRGLSPSELLRKVVEDFVTQAMLRTTGRFIGSANSGLKQFVHDVRKKAGKE